MPASLRPIDRGLLPTGALAVRVGPTGQPFYEAVWRRDGRRMKRRIGPAWLERDADGSWRRARGRAPNGYFEEKRAIQAMRDVIAEIESDAMARVDEDRRAAARSQTFRVLCHNWLDHQQKVKRVKPSTLRDLQSVLAEPGTPHLRGSGERKGRVLKRFGDVPASDITPDDVDEFLDELSEDGVSVRTVNRHREILRAIFNFGMTRRSAFRLTTNPAAESTLRRADAPGRLEVFDVEQVEALARAAAAGEWRTRTDGGADDRRRRSAQWVLDEATVRLRRAEDEQLAELLRVACYTGLRRGELVVLRWRDIRWAERVLVVERALSDGVEVAPKSRRSRYVPLADQPFAALERLSRRPNFVGADDYVFANVVGDRLDPSALRRRYVFARDVANLPPLRFHDLRHTAGSLLVREIDPASVKDILGHADMKTTERYLHAQRASSLAVAATRAFTTATGGEPRSRLAEARALLADLAPEEREALLADHAAA